MAEDTSTEPAETDPKPLDSATENMEFADESAGNGAKRGRENDEDAHDDVSKKLKVDGSSSSERLEKLERDEKDLGDEPVRVSLGPKSFGSSVEMFDYFYNFLHHWPPNVNVNKYEQMVLLDLIKKGYSEPEKKIGCGIRAFQIRNHPMWKSRCFFIIRDDDTVDDFSFRKCVDNILPLPEDMKIKSDVHNRSQSGYGGGGRGRGRRGGGGRGGKARN